MRRTTILAFIALIGAALVGCAGDNLAPVVDRSGGDSGATHYEVQRGDTLHAIAWRHGVDHRDLAQWNDVERPDRIYAGQTLRLTAPEGGRDRAQEAANRGEPEPEPTEPEEATAAAEPPETDNGAVAGSDGDWHWPTDGDVVKAFAVDADGKQGINIAGTHGQSIHAAGDGRVVYSGSGLIGYGNLVIIKHDDTFLTAYGYNSRLLVDEGEAVDAGQPIAEMGRNGEGDAVLHFELRKEGQPVDPTGHLSP